MAQANIKTPTMPLQSPTNLRAPAPTAKSLQSHSVITRDLILNQALSQYEYTGEKLHQELNRPGSPLKNIVANMEAIFEAERTNQVKREAVHTKSQIRDEKTNALLNLWAVSQEKGIDFKDFVQEKLNLNPQQAEMVSQLAPQLSQLNNDT
jgi:hypothetical protein